MSKYTSRDGEYAAAQHQRINAVFSKPPDLGVLGEALRKREQAIKDENLLEYVKRHGWELAGGVSGSVLKKGDFLIDLRNGSRKQAFGVPWEYPTGT